MSMLERKDRDFLENFVIDSVEYYEKESNKNLDIMNLESIRDYICFFGGEILFADYYDKNGVDELVVTTADEGFIIAIDKNYIENTYFDDMQPIIKSIFRQFYFYLNYYWSLGMDGKPEVHYVIYPDIMYKSLSSDLRKSIEDIEKENLGKRLVKVLNDRKNNIHK